MNLRDAPISFPGLFGDWQFTVSGKLLDIGNGIYWYGALIALGLLLALALCARQAPRFGLKPDDVTDVILWLMPAAIVGARAYYVIFYFDLYRDADGAPDFGKMLRIWDGGLAVYGGILFGFLTALLVCRRKKIPMWAVTDCCVAGLLIGQAVGRWGNFMNREAYGAETDLPWRMRIWLSGGGYMDVHPTFLYESLWNLIGLALVVFVLTKRRRFDGQNTCFYFLWYGLGRFWIESLRADSLYLFNLTLFGARVRVSQALSLLLALAAAAVLFHALRVRRADGSALWVRRAAADAPPEDHA